ncbi:nucleoside hydrolase [Schaalia cardiffensis]|uniref:nucleoside hydrolase n=1 Tax=Schaalia cardiffensis TaxID=181487 RepID=UPI00039EAA53|nr:nucleoside hydrolase [Schaalia cardiffensis]
MKKRPLYFDCDPGVDDALALAYLLNSSEVSLVGIGTICGNVDVEHTTENALRLLALAGRQDVPVTMGERCYLTREYTHRAVQIHGANGIGDVELPPSDLAPTGESAAEMILHLSDEYEGELEICAVGPLTNLARALDLDPSLPQRVKQVVVMGGAALVPGNVSPVAEANIFCDPEAASAVVRAPWDVTLVGLDVTLENVMEESHREQLLASDQPLVGALGRILDVYYDFYQPQFGRRCSPLHDPLAAAIAVGTVKVVDSPWVNVIVDDTEGPGRGQTIADLRGQRLGPIDQEGAHVRMVLKTDRPFADHLVARILGRE